MKTHPFGNGASLLPFALFASIDDFLNADCDARETCPFLQQGAYTRYVPCGSEMGVVWPLNVLVSCDCKMDLFGFSKMMTMMMDVGV